MRVKMGGTSRPSASHEPADSRLFYPDKYTLEAQFPGSRPRGTAKLGLYLAFPAQNQRFQTGIPYAVHSARFGRSGDFSANRHDQRVMHDAELPALAACRADIRRAIQFSPSWVVDRSSESANHQERGNPGTSEHRGCLPGVVRRRQFAAAAQGNQRESSSTLIPRRHHPHRRRLHCRHRPDRPRCAACGPGRPRACGRRRWRQATAHATRVRSPCRWKSR
jgi:hypothetical protein